MEFFPEIADCFRIALLSRHRDRGIAGQQLLQPEDQDRDEEQRRDDLRQAAQQEAPHR
jgi:hypothetical protein